MKRLMLVFTVIIAIAFSLSLSAVIAQVELCEGDFDCDQDVDGADVAIFKSNFGRGPTLNPCTTENPCLGDFNCDYDCDGNDSFKLKQDFGRNSLQKPCPVCISCGQWCSLPTMEQDSFTLSEFQYNSMDTHMYWDGIYLWLPETEYLNSTSRFSTNLIRLNPEDFSYTRYTLPQINYNGIDTHPIVYEVVPSPSNSDILYISAPYGEPKAIYVFSQSNESALGYQLINGELVYWGSNGARMAVTVSGGDDTIWITSNQSTIATFDVASATVTELYNFSSISPGGLYGIAAVPTVTGDEYIIHVASFGGKLLIFPSNLTSIRQNIVIDVTDFGVREAVLMALIYDESYIWIAGYGRYSENIRLFIMRYTPASRYDVVGESTFYWSNVSTGMIPSLISYGNWVFAVVEHMDCASRELLRLNKTTGVVEDIEIQFEYPRVAASLGYDDAGNIYAGGFGCSSENIRPLELVRFKTDGE